MTRTKLGLLGLCAMVFALMAFSATSAQAIVGAKWLILNAKGELKTGSELPAEFGLEVDTVPVLHTKIAGIAVLFLCEKIHLTGATMTPTGIGNGALITFLGCHTALNGVVTAACKPNNAGKESGVIKTLDGHALLELHELAGGVKDDILKILPDSGETFAFIEMSEECAIGSKVPVIGKATLKDCENLALTHLVKHLVEVGPLTELWTISKTAEHVATILGSSWAFLRGAHENLKWSGDPL